MRKIILAVLLLAILAVVSYFSIELNKEQMAESRLEGLKVGNTLIDSQVQLIDSLRADLADQREILAQTVAEADESSGQRIDSLTALIKEKNLAISSLEDQKATLARQPESAPSRKSEANARHREIISHYNKMIARLPGDLSDYERRVALTEVREETAERFSIPIEQLDEIREENNLD